MVLLPASGNICGGGADGDEGEDEEIDEDTGGVPLGWLDEFPGWKMSFCGPSWKLYRSL